MNTAGIDNFFLVLGRSSLEAGGLVVLVLAAQWIFRSSLLRAGAVPCGCWWSCGCCCHFRSAVSPVFSISYRSGHTPTLPVRWKQLQSRQRALPTRSLHFRQQTEWTRRRLNIRPRSDCRIQRRQPLQHLRLQLQRPVNSHGPGRYGFWECGWREYFSWAVMSLFPRFDCVDIAPGCSR